MLTSCLKDYQPRRQTLVIVEDTRQRTDLHAMSNDDHALAEIYCQNYECDLCHGRARIRSGRIVTEHTPWCKYYRPAWKPGR
jgi:hypothetical protein